MVDKQEIRSLFTCDGQVLACFYYVTRTIWFYDDYQNGRALIMFLSWIAQLCCHLNHWQIKQYDPWSLLGWNYNHFKISTAKITSPHDLWYFFCHGRRFAFGVVLSVLGLTTPAAFDAGGGSKHGQKHGSKIAAKSCLLMSLPFLFFWGGGGKDTRIEYLSRAFFNRVWVECPSEVPFFFKKDNTMSRFVQPHLAWYLWFS